MTLTLAHHAMPESWAGVRYSRMLRYDIILSCRCKGNMSLSRNWEREGKWTKGGEDSPVRTQYEDISS